MATVLAYEKGWKPFIMLLKTRMNRNNVKPRQQLASASQTSWPGNETSTCPMPRVRQRANIGVFSFDAKGVPKDKALE
jgi:hypothetical protein